MLSQHSFFLFSSAVLGGVLSKSHYIRVTNITVWTMLQSRNKGSIFICFCQRCFFVFFSRGTNVLEEFRVVLPYFWRFLLHWVSEVTLVFVREGVPAWFLLCLRGFDFVFLPFLVLLWT